MLAPALCQVFELQIAKDPAGASSDISSSMTSFTNVGYLRLQCLPGTRPVTPIIMGEIVDHPDTLGREGEFRQGVRQLLLRGIYETQLGPRYETRECWRRGQRVCSRHPERSW